MKENFIIITGASKGLGRELAIKSAHPNVQMLLIARDIKALKNVQDICESKEAKVQILACDFSITGYQESISEVFNKISIGSIAKLQLYNNASMIEPISEFSKTNSNDHQDLMNVNLMAPIWLSSELIRCSNRILPDTVSIINISSGVSKKAIDGWSLYCMSKASINMLSACIAAESHRYTYNLESMCVNPGALDTDMQKAIRNSDAEEVPITDKFKKMYEDGMLKTTADVAAKLLQIVSNKQFENGSYIDFNQLD
ncbi:MAG: benzil reductase ((S)-benzoin forming) [Psychroserpens sp.]